MAPLMGLADRIVVAPPVSSLAFCSLRRGCALSFAQSAARSCIARLKPLARHKKLRASVSCISRVDVVQHAAFAFWPA